MTYIAKMVIIGILFSVIIVFALYFLAKAVFRFLAKAVFRFLESRDICRHCKNAKLCIKVKYLYPDSYLFKYSPNRFYCSAYNKDDGNDE